MANIIRETGTTVQALVVANATVDELYQVQALPATGESLIGRLRLRDVGGKGANVATVLARCGVPTRLMAMIGNDGRGRFVQQTLTKEPMTLELIVSEDHPTDLSLIYSDAQGDNVIVSTVAATQSLTAKRVDAAMNTLRKHDLIILQGNLGEELTHWIIDRARQLDLTVVFNPSPMRSWMHEIVGDVDTVFLNNGEAIALTGLSDRSAVMALLAEGPTNIVLTRGGSSSIWGHTSLNIDGTKNESIKYVPVKATSVLDTTGAGDTYLAVAIASAVLRHETLDELALKQAASAAAITVSRYGTHQALPVMSELADILAG